MAIETHQLAVPDGKLATGTLPSELVEKEEDRSKETREEAWERELRGLREVSGSSAGEGAARR